MTIESHEPSRWLDDTELDPQVRSLLVAGRSQQPAPHVLRAAPAAVATLLAAQGIAYSAAAAAAPLTAAVPLPHAGLGAAFGTLFKWVGVGLVAGFSAASVAEAVTHLESQGARETPPALAAASSNRRRQSPDRATPIRAAAAAELSDAPAVVEPARRSSSNSTGEPRPPLDTVEREVRLLDDARAALAVGRPTLALDHLDRAARLPRPLLEPEAAVLRVRALLRLQRRAEADRVVRSWESRAPHSPQAEVLRKLLVSPDVIQTPATELSR